MKTLGQLICVCGNIIGIAGGGCLLVGAVTIFFGHAFILGFGVAGWLISYLLGAIGGAIEERAEYNDSL